MNTYLNNLIQTTCRNCCAISSGLKSKLHNFFSYQTYFEDVAAFADEIDLKTLKAINVSHKSIYPEMWRIAKKLIKINVILIIGNAFIQGLILSTFSHEFWQDMLHSIRIHMLMYIIPFIILLKYIWKYNLFKFGIAASVNYGKNICNALETIAKKIMIIWIAMQCFDTFWLSLCYLLDGYITKSMYRSIDSLSICTCMGGTIMLAILVSWMATFEMERLSIKPLFAAINNLLYNKK